MSYLQHFASYRIWKWCAIWICFISILKRNFRRNLLWSKLKFKDSILRKTSHKLFSLFTPIELSIPINHIEYTLIWGLILYLPFYKTSIVHLVIMDVFHKWYLLFSASQWILIFVATLLIYSTCEFMIPNFVNENESKNKCNVMLEEN